MPAPMPPTPIAHVNPRSAFACRANIDSEQLPIWIFANWMASRFQCCRYDCVGMGLQQGHRIFRGGLAKQSDPQRRLLPGTRIAVDAHLSRGKALADPQCDRHGRNKLVGRTERPVRQRDDRINIVVLNADGRVCDFLQRRVVKWMAAGLVIGNVSILAPPTHSNVHRCLVDRGLHLFHRRG